MKNIFGKFNIVDIIIVLGVIIALIIGIATTKHFRQTADKQIEATSPITFSGIFARCNCNRTGISCKVWR